MTNIIERWDDKNQMSKSIKRWSIIAVASVSLSTCNHFKPSVIEDPAWPFGFFQYQD
jgi:hypothetical protein|tara:strand:+ start:278 stop:448 length:171 start_codon:yes stop_codon:yes gene_type:complete